MYSTLPAWVKQAIRIFVPKRDQETITTELIEDYEKDCEEHCEEYARKQLKRNVLRSIGHFMITRLRQAGVVAYAIWRYWHSGGD